MEVVVVVRCDGCSVSLVAVVAVMVPQQELVTMKGYSSDDDDDQAEEEEEEEESSESPLTSIQRPSQDSVRVVSSSSP